MDLIKTEERGANRLTAYFIIALVSGLLHLWGGLSDIYYLHELVLAVHIFAALAFLICFCIYCYYHLKRTYKSRRNSAFFSGALCLIISIASLYSGIALLSDARYQLIGRALDIQSLHLWSSLLFLTAFVAHALASRLTENKRPGNNPPRITPRLRVDLSTSLITIITLTAVLIGGLWLNPNTIRTAPIIKDYLYSYGLNPFSPSQTTTPDNQFVHTISIAQSDKCGTCHTDIYQQWQQSAHRLAAADPAYVKNINLLEKNKGIASTRYCEGCHAPVALLTGQLTPGAKHGGTPGTTAFNEGVSCLTCHRMGKINNTEGVASYHYVAVENSPLLNAKNQFGQHLANFLVLASPRKHTTIFSNRITTSPESCATCHAQFMDKDMNNWGWVKMQDEYTAWLESPFSHHGDDLFADSQSKNCQDCHMPLMPSQDPAVGKDGMIKSHNFAAANTVTALAFGYDEQLAAVYEFLQSNRMRVTIEKPRNNPLINQNTTTDVSSTTHREAPMHFYGGQEATLNVAIANIGVGHNFPGGTTDIQEAWLHLEAIDAEGKTIYETGRSDSAEGAIAVYKTIAVNREGKPVWKHDLFNMVGDTYKNYIAAGETDIVTATFHVPKTAKSPITFHASLRYRKFNQQYANWVFDDKPPEIPAIEMARDTISIPLLLEKPAS